MKKTIFLALGFLCCSCSVFQKAPKPILVNIKTEGCDIILSWNSQKTGIYTVYHRTNMNGVWEEYKSLKLRRGNVSVRVPINNPYGYYKVALIK